MLGPESSQVSLVESEVLLSKASQASLEKKKAKERVESRELKRPRKVTAGKDHSNEQPNLIVTSEIACQLQNLQFAMRICDGDKVLERLVVDVS